MGKTTSRSGVHVVFTEREAIVLLSVIQKARYSRGETRDAIYTAEDKLALEIRKQVLRLDE